MVQIGKDIRVQAEEFKGKWYVSIRKWYEDDEGEWRPTRKGINMKVEEWNEFLQKLDEIRKDIGSQTKD
ncbi:MAG: transcriptional coactivator p15/PC4 family protein [Spirochaetia bacterium]